jgi:glycosyltransferase involved in cell wall biosynthesis
MTKLKITGLKESSFQPAENGTFEHIGAKGGTEQMFERLMNFLPQEATDEFNIICSRVRSVDPSKKNILWLHDTWDDPESEHLKDPKSLERFKKLVFVSHYQQSTYNLGLGVPYSKGVVLQNAIDPIEDHEKPRGSTINLIYHTTPHRGLELLVPVAEFMTEKGFDYHLDVFSSFKIYGWEQRDEPYKAIFDRCMRNPNITYHGYQPNSVIREALKKAHIYAYPNIWPETSAISVIEAMSAGCQVICPNFAALPETCANFANMYGWNEDHNEHANLFANILFNSMNEHWSDGVQNKLKFQKMYFNNFYSWDYRKEQWRGFLYSLRDKKS